MRTFARLATALTMAAGLAACGGGGAGGSGDAMVDVQIQPPAASQGGDTIRVSAIIHARRNLLQSVSWSALAAASGAPSLTLANADCSAGQKNDSVFKDYKESVWTCEAQAIAPPDLAADAQYRFMVRGVDSAGNSGAGDALVTVKAASGERPPLEVWTDPASVSLRPGAKAELSCSAHGGYLASGAHYTYQWRIVSNPLALQVVMTDDGAGRLKFVAPDVEYAGAITFGCVATDTALRSATGLTQVIIEPAPAPAPIVVADAGGAQTVQGKAVVTLDASHSAVWVGGQTQSTYLYYLWEQIAGPTVQLAGATLAKPTFIAPTVTDITALRFRVKADLAPITSQSNLAPSAIAETAVYVSAQAPLAVTVAPPVAPADPGSAVNLQATVSGNGTDPVFYAWTQISGPHVSLSGASTSGVSFVAPDVTSAASVTLRVRAARSPSDLNSVPPAAQTEVTVAIKPPVAPPALTVQAFGPATPIGAGEVANLQAVVSGAQSGDTIYYGWTQVSGPAVSLSSLTSANTAFVAPAVTETTLITLRVMAARSPGDIGHVPPAAMTEVTVAVHP